MRPARFVLALLFGAAVLITFLKLLFFALFAAAILGGIYLIGRTLHLAFLGRQWQRSQYGAPYQPQYQASYQQPWMAQPQQRPISLGFNAQNQPQPAFARHIEVL